MVGFTCNHCQKHNELPVRSSNLIIDDVPEELTKDGGVMLPFTNFPQGLYIRAPKVGDIYITNALMKKHEISEDDLDMKSLILDLNLFRNKVNGMDIEDLYQAYLDNKFTPSDLINISSFRQACEWGVRDEYKFTCEHCKEEVIVEEPLDITRFFLSSESKRSFRDRILPSVPAEAVDNGNRESTVEGDMVVLQEARKNHRNYRTDERTAERSV